MFDDIRPYRNDEVANVIQQLILSTELQTTIAKLQLPTLFKIAPSLSRFLIKLSLKFRTKNFDNIDKIQLEVAKYLHKLIKDSTDGFTFSGIENIDVNKPTLFISNHRDIVLDVALVNLALFQNNIPTVEAAVGDNLLKQQWVADLMRINKSFIVKRNVENKREMLKASKQLSAYIHDSIINRQQNLWIAQREGRAKDGLDKTNPAVISMLLLNKPKSTSIADYLSQINIIPVSIAYEFDPCDADKAIELAEIESTGQYNKQEDEDLRSITQGLVGQKGKIHLAFGRTICGDFKGSQEIANAIDKEIIKNYRLFDSNLVAYEILEGHTHSDKHLSIVNNFHQRMSSLTAMQKKWFLTMYANPVYEKIAKHDLVLNNKIHTNKSYKPEEHG